MTRTSQTGQALKALARTHQRPWPEILRDLADRGYSWADVADIAGVPARNLKAYCRYRNLTFPWQRMASPIQRERQRRCWAERGMAGNRYAPRYTVLGFTGTKGEIADHFGLNVNTLNTRLYRHGMSLEDAVTQPVITCRDAGHLGQAELKRRGTRSDFWKHEGALHFGHSTATPPRL